MTQPDPIETLTQSPLHAIEDPQKLDEMLAALSDRADRSWYLIDPQAELPTTPASEEEDVQEFIIRADVLIQRSQAAGQRPRLEIDDPDAPGLVRLYSDVDETAPVLWIMSLTPPAHSDQSADTEAAPDGSAPPPTDDAAAGIDAPADSGPDGDQASVGDDSADPSQDNAGSQNAEVTTEAADAPPSVSYMEQFDGKLIAMRKWEDLDELWTGIHGSADDGYYIYTIGETPPTEPADKETVHRFILDIDTLLRREHKENYCGIVYADNKTRPTFVKIYDPHNLGMVCGSSGVRTLPGWTLSKTQPVELEPEQKNDPQPRGFMRWKGLFSRK